MKMVTFHACYSPFLSYLILQQGLVYESQGNISEAKRCYENAIAINPNHTNALQHLVIIFNITIIEL